MGRLNKDGSSKSEMRDFDLISLAQVGRGDEKL